MQIETSIATKAYAAIREQVHAPAAVDSLTSGGFSALVQNLVANVQQTGGAAESEMAKSAAGQGDSIKTVATVNAAEIALETLVAVRDRMVTAYNDVIRMQI